MRSVLKPIKPRRLLERGTAPADFAFAIIIKFTDRAIELSSHVCVSSKMKVVAFALVLMPLICGAAEPLLPMAEGTTWNYELVQERPSASLDLTEPDEQERLSVSYRVGGTAKIDNRDLRDRKSTRLNSSHVKISYAVFCVKKKISGDGITMAAIVHIAICNPGVLDTQLARTTRIASYSNALPRSPTVPMVHVLRSLPLLRS